MNTKLSAGLYFIKASTENEAITEKLIIY
jgi:hypothetical protein